MRTAPLHGSSKHSSVGSEVFGDHPSKAHRDAGNPSDDGVHTCTAATHALSVVRPESAQVPPNPFYELQGEWSVSQLGERTR